MCNSIFLAFSKQQQEANKPQEELHLYPMVNAHLYFRNYKFVSIAIIQNPISATYIKRQRLAAIRPLIPINPHQRLAALKQSRLQTDDDELHPRRSMLANVIRDLRHIGIIQRSIDLIKHEERRWLVAVHCKEEGQGRHGLLAARKVVHVSEALERRHRVVFDAGEVGLVGVFDIEVTVRCSQ